MNCGSTKAEVVESNVIGGSVSANVVTVYKTWSP